MRIWAEINEKALAYNIDVIKKSIGSRELMAVLKANAYGHGDKLMSSLLYKLGVRKFAVASLEEALRIRKQLRDAYILIIGATLPEDFQKAIENDIAITIHSISSLEVALKYEGFEKFHLKVDTGMHRVGLKPEEIRTRVNLIEKIKFEGISTHLATSDEDDRSYTYKQLEEFNEVVSFLSNRGINFKYIHTANSAATLHHDLTNTNLVRAGIAIYGIDPSQSNRLKLKPILSLKSKVMHILEVKKGQSVGYARKYVADRDRKIAVVAVGYADGLLRNLSEKMQVYINGNFVRQIGYITMDHIMVDITDVDVKLSQEVEIIGEHISAEDLAKKADTIVYEIFTGLSERIVRVTS